LTVFLGHWNTVEGALGITSPLIILPAESTGLDTRRRYSRKVVIAVTGLRATIDATNDNVALQTSRLAHIESPLLWAIEVVLILVGTRLSLIVVFTASKSKTCEGY